MAIQKHLLKHITHGDYSRIAELYNNRHLKEQILTDASYVRKVINGIVDATPGTIAEGILIVAQNYLSMKSEFSRKMVLA